MATSLPTRPFGRTDMQITRVGFGAWAAGGAGHGIGWGPQDDGESVAAMRRAVALGVNWIDTAAIYGRGHSEDIVRQAIEGIAPQDRPYIFTKCGLRWDESDPAAPVRRTGARASLMEEVDLSLKRLGVERIDLYQMHWPSEDGTPIEEYWQALLDLKASGKVRAVGLSNHNVAQLEKAEALGHVDTLQPPFSAIRRDVAVAELPWCRAHQTGVIVYSPMQAGLLTGRFSVERVASLPANDWRTGNAQFQGEALERNLRLAAALAPIAGRLQTSPGAVAIAWGLAWPAVTGAIVGARSAAQVDGWIDGARLELSVGDLAEIAAAIESTGAGSGPAMPPA